MARRWTEKVVPYPTHKRDARYLMRVEAIRKVRSGHAHFALRLVHLDIEQEGRVVETELPVPIRPAGRTAQFFTACGIPVAIGAEVQPRAAVGCIVLVVFRDEQIMSFEEVPDESRRS